MPKNNLSIIDNLRNTIGLDKNEHSTLADVIDSIDVSLPEVEEVK